MNNLKKTMNETSSSLISKLESINWSFTLPATLDGSETIILVKYIFEDDSYGIMISDFATTYFECSIGEQIDKNYHRYNKASLTQCNIRICLKEVLKTLCHTVKSIEKIEIDCHTTRITLRCSKIITKNFNYHWNFHLISTGPEIFLKHFSMPMFRGLMYYYTLNQKQEDSMATNSIADISNQSNNSEDNNFSPPSSLSSSPQYVQSPEQINCESSIPSGIYEMTNLVALNQMNANILHQLFRIN